MSRKRVRGLNFGPSSGWRSDAIQRLLINYRREHGLQRERSGGGIRSDHAYGREG